MTVVKITEGAVVVRAMAIRSRAPVVLKRQRVLFVGSEMSRGAASVATWSLAHTAA